MVTLPFTTELTLRCADLYIKSLTFKNYRNLSDEKIFPSEGINVIYGDNAQGKTNLIECIWLFTGGRSFRGSKDSELISFGEKRALTELCFYSKNREHTISMEISGGKRSAVLNDVPKNYLSQIVGVFCAVVFSPDHLTLIKNGPEERRNFIDAAICQIKPGYAVRLSRYKKVLNERNALLKDIPKHRELEDMLDIWNERLASEGAVITAERKKYVKKLSELAAGFYDGISGGKENLSVSYRSGCTDDINSVQEIKDSLLRTLESKQSDDIYCGYTTSGVHRDDLAIKINGREARNFGSQGQQRSAVLSLKLAEAAVSGDENGEKPVILLDDVLSELDESRQNYLLHKLQGLQVFITCCEKEIEADSKFRISAGNIISSGE